LEDATTILRVLARSATGQDMSVYTTFCTGSKRPNDLDGPEKFHVVLIDNGRSKLLGGEFNDMLMCIRCGACLNHCPVYKAIGGHAYGWVYSGPMGAALMPGLIGIEKARHLPNASTLCGKCEAVCPVRIPLPSLLRSWRKREFEEQKKPTVGSRLLKSWSFLAMRPFLYRLIFATLIATLAFLGRNKGWFRRAPFFSGWTQHRDFPAPEGGTFVARWNRGERL
jgi:L-lactate dehydrogenase complex protein LldF